MLVGMPGSISPSAASIFEEGIRIPNKVYAEVFYRRYYSLGRNTREPEDRNLDLKVQIATNDFGVIQTTKLIEKMGLEAMEVAVEDLLIYTSRRLKTSLALKQEAVHSQLGWMMMDLRAKHFL